MGAKATTIWVVLAALLTAAALWAPTPGGDGPEQGAPLALDPASVVEIPFTPAGGEAYRLERAASLAGDWLVVRGSNGDESAWPADATAVRAALRTATTSPLGDRSERDDEGESDAPAATRIEFITDHGGVRTSVRVTIAQGVLAGQAAGTVEGGGRGSPRAVWIGPEFVRALAGQGPDAWLDRSVFARLVASQGAAAPHTYEVRTDASSVRLARGPRGWRVESPRALPAEVSRVDAALGSLAQLAAERLDFVPAQTADAREQALVRVASGERASPPWSMTLRVLGAGASDGMIEIELVGTLGQTTLGPVRGQAEAKPLTSISAAAADYAARRALAFGAADIAAIELYKGETLVTKATRTIDGWTSDDDATTLTAPALVALLTGDKPARVDLGPTLTAQSGALTLRVLGVGGVVLSELTLAPQTNNTAAFTASETLPGGSTIVRTYTGREAAGVVSWLTR